MAYRADNGDQLWESPVQTGIMAPPISYSIEGEQYITVLAGWGGAFGLMAGVKQPAGPKRSRVLTFKLGGNTQLPAVVEDQDFPEPPPMPEVEDTVIKHGSELYENYCSFCHGIGMISGGTIPDLRRLPPHFHDSFQQIVHEGTFMHNFGFERY